MLPQWVHALGLALQRTFAMKSDLTYTSGLVHGLYNRPNMQTLLEVVMYIALGWREEGRHVQPAWHFPAAEDIYMSLHPIYACHCSSSVLHG